jgi:hypothetical protein
MAHVEPWWPRYLLVLESNSKNLLTVEKEGGGGA